MTFKSKSGIATITKADVTIESKYNENEPADFETAISATGFGKFNIFLLLVSVPACFSSSFATTTMSYILPAAQCDLSLTLVDKGMLNACTYVGMITSAFLWGYLADVLGRKKLQIYGYLLDVLCNIACAFSQTFWLLLIFKYFSGFIVCGPFAILMSYLSEFHSNEYRARIIMFSGVLLSLSNVLLPLLAWWIIPQTSLSLDFFNGFIHLSSWQIFLIICAIPSLIAAFGHMLLPESPKFLMTIGKNEKALQIFQEVFTINTNKDKELFPVKILVQETMVNEQETIVDTKEKLKELEKSAKRSNLKALLNGWAQIRPLFHKPYLMKILLVLSLQFGAMMGVNTLRLWLPQLFTTIDEYSQAHNYSSDASLCEMIAYSSNINEISNDSNIYNYADTLNIPKVEECKVIEVDDVVYINSIIVASFSVIGYMFVGTLINALGKKKLTIIMFVISGLAGVANYWSRSSIATLAYSSTFITIAGIGSQVITGFVVEMFPTSLRTMTVSLSLMFGRVGAIIGNMLFPILLETGCLPPFLLVGGMTTACALLCILLPSKTLDFK